MANWTLKYDIEFPESFLSPAADRYEAVEAGLELGAKLQEQNPGVFLCSGTTLTRPYGVVIRADVPLDCPEVYKTDEGYMFNVHFMCWEGANVEG
jgi:hypothetical protein